MRIPSPSQDGLKQQTMKSKHRICNATTVIHGQRLYCQGVRGHRSAHFDDHRWWDNRQGLPIERQREKRRDRKQRLRHNVTRRNVIKLVIALVAVLGSIAFALIHWQ